MSKQFEVIVKEVHRRGYLVDAETEEEARQLVEHPERSYQQTFDEYYDLEAIESVEEQS